MAGAGGSALSETGGTGRGAAEAGAAEAFGFVVSGLSWPGPGGPATRGREMATGDSRGFAGCRAGAGLSGRPGSRAASSVSNVPTNGPGREAGPGKAETAGSGSGADRVGPERVDAGGPPAVATPAGVIASAARARPVSPRARDAEGPGETSLPVGAAGAASPGRGVTGRSRDASPGEPAEPAACPSGIWGEGSVAAGRDGSGLAGSTATGAAPGAGGSAGAGPAWTSSGAGGSTRAPSAAMGVLCGGTAEAAGSWVWGTRTAATGAAGRPVAGAGRGPAELSRARGGAGRGAMPPTAAPGSTSSAPTGKPKSQPRPVGTWTSGATAATTRAWRAREATRPRSMTTPDGRTGRGAWPGRRCRGAGGTDGDGGTPNRTPVVPGQRTSFSVSAKATEGPTSGGVCPSL
jgi:hypothetical protein